LDQRFDTGNVFALESLLGIEAGLLDKLKPALSALAGRNFTPPRSPGISETMWKLQELVGQVYNLSQWACGPQKDGCVTFLR